MGDNVGDIAGMGADLFGSFAESTCAALVVSSVSALGAQHSWVGMCYPLLITGSGKRAAQGRRVRRAAATARAHPVPLPCPRPRAGIVVCVLTTLIATDLKPVRVVSEIESTLKVQLVVSTLAMTPVSAGAGGGGCSVGRAAGRAAPRDSV